MPNEKFNLLMPESDERALCFLIDKPFSAEGYEQNFLPKLEDQIAKTGEIRVLLYFKNYQGWEEEAAAKDMTTSARYGKKVKKLAFINPPPKMIAHYKLKGPLLSGEFKTFDDTQITEAVAWVKN